MYIVTWIQTHVLVPEVQRVTRMDISSIAFAFGPCVLRSAEPLKVDEMVKSMHAQNKFMVNILMLLNTSLDDSNHKVTLIIVVELCSPWVSYVLILCIDSVITAQSQS